MQKTVSLSQLADLFQQLAEAYQLGETSPLVEITIVDEQTIQLVAEVNLGKALEGLI
jgi:hypothetical protein